MKIGAVGMIAVTFLLQLWYACEEDNIVIKEISDADYYVATDGNDDNPGTYDRPWATWLKAVKSVQAGDTVYIRGGTYKISDIEHCVFVTRKNGTTNQPICVLNYPGETPILDLSEINTTGKHLYGFKISYSKNWHIKGLQIQNLNQPIDGNLVLGFVAYGCDSLTVENVIVNNIGGTGFAIGDTMRNINILNCDSYNNNDNISKGENANGFSITGDGIKSNVRIKGCRAWNNSDDGFDNYGCDGQVLYDSCWAFNNGYGSNGDGFGFKLGPQGDDTKQILIRYSIAANNSCIGFGQNAQLKPITFYHNSTYKNGTEGFSCGYGTGVYTFRNNLTYAESNNSFNSYAIHDHNSWDYPIVVTEDDFVSLDLLHLYKERKSDGSLPDISFLKLTSGSDLINAGVDVELPFFGAAPDLGAFEKK